MPPPRDLDPAVIATVDRVRQTVFAKLFVTMSEVDYDLAAWRRELAEAKRRKTRPVSRWFQ